MTEMQSDFEDWLKEFRGDSQAKMPASLEYMAWQTWQKAWQASRAAAVVKLPPAREDQNYYDVMDSGMVKDALDEAGVKHEQG